MHRVFRIWRNLITLKRAGRGHDPEGIGNTPPGSLTVECPACPHPGRNLPENWMDAGPLMFVIVMSFFLSEKSYDSQVSLYFVHIHRRKL